MVWSTMMKNKNHNYPFLVVLYMPTKRSQVLALRHKLAFGVGQTAEGLKFNAFNTFLLFYYSQILGLSASICGLAIFIALCVDAITDPIAGYLSDNTKSKWGRRHPYMFVSIIPLGISFYCLFNPPTGMTDNPLFIWLTVTAIGVRVSMTLFSIPHMSLGAELSDDYVERSSIFGVSTFFGFFGGITCAALGYLWFFKATPEQPNGLLNAAAYPDFGTTLAIGMMVAIALCAYGTLPLIKNLHTIDSQSNGPFLKSVFEGFLEAFRSSSFKVLFLGYVIMMCFFGTRDALLLYMATYFWELTSLQISFYIGAYFVGMLTAVALIKPISQILDKKQILIFSSIIYFVLSSTPAVLRMLDLMPTNDSEFLLPLLVLFAWSASVNIILVMITVNSMLADIADEYELKTGERREGIFYSARAFGVKASSGIGHLLAGFAIDVINFPKEAEPGTVATSILNNLAIFDSVILSSVGILSAFLFFNYRLTRRKHAYIQAKLQGTDPT